MPRDPLDQVLPEGLDPDDLADALPSGLELHVDAANRSRRAFYETFDGLLGGAGLGLTHEDARLILRDDAGREVAALAWPRAPDRLLVADLDPGPLRKRLAPVAGVRALVRVAQVRCSTRVLRVRNGDAKIVLRLIVEEPRLAGASDGALCRRLRFAPVRGYDGELRRVSGALGDHLGVAPAESSLRDEAVTRAGGAPEGVSSKLDVRLDAAERADRAAVAIARRLLEVIEANLPGTLADVDSEFLHDLRVAVRRTRSLQRELRGVFPAERLAHARAEFRRLQEVTGPCRDLDVYLLGFDSFRELLPEPRRADLEPVRRLLAAQRARERRRMVRALRSPRTAAALAEWDALLTALTVPGRPATADARLPIGTVASRRIARVYRQIVSAGSAIDGRSPHQDLHDLRKRSKELRYLLEFFGSLYPAKVIKPMTRALKDLQDTLGRFQDREVQSARIRALGPEAAALEDGPAVLLAMGQLVERLEAQQAEARAEFLERFAAFASDAQRALAREVFR